jgi:hypothetical protein
MRVFRFGFAALATATILGSFACGDARRADTTGPTSFAIGQATCNFTVMADLVRMYLPPADQGTAKTLIAQMKAFFNGGDLNKATDKGFDILALIAARTNAGTQIGTPQVGSQLINAMLACMSVGNPTLPINFSGPLGPGGIGVRGGATDLTGPVLSRDSFSGVGLQESTWQAVFGQRVLLFGQPKPGAIFNELLVGPPYEWSTLPPKPSVNPGAVIGFCVSNIGRYRVEESHTATPHTILFLKDAGSFLSCPNFPLGPNPNKVLGPVGGSATGFSDFAAVDAQAINLNYLNQPSTVQAGQIISPAVRIQATGNGSTPLPEVTIALTLVPVSGSGSLSGTKTKITSTTGIETFDDLRVSQPGTYTLLATSTAVGFGTTLLGSVQFTVTP